MLRLPLIFGADPKLIKKGAIVRLGAGVWKFIEVGIVDTQYIVNYLSGNEVQAVITQPGTERYISLFAEKQC